MSFELGITSQKRLTQPFLYQRIETDDVVFSTSEGSNLSKTIGYALLVISALCSAFGNSLESVSTLVWLITPTLLVGLHYVLQPFQLSSSATATALVFVVVSQGAGFMVGFLTMFSDEDVTASTVLITFAVGCFLWVIISAVSLLALLGFTQKYESSVWASFIFPITYTV